jgi:hypothetical protein
MSAEFSHQKEEYLALRKEVENALADLSSLERNCVLAMSAVYAWLISKGFSAGMDGVLGWGIPLLLSLFGALRCYSINRHLGTMGAYIAKIEAINKPGGEEWVGWETFFRNTGGGIQTTIRMWFWGVLITFALVVWLLKVCGCH